MGQHCPKCGKVTWIKRWITCASHDNKEFPWARCFNCYWKGFLW